tara:strand:+ start:1128 stop:1544 length:417 start_codon:yes stop_codon:yes gene_type:complete
MQNLANELKNVIKDYIIFKPKNKDELQKAVDLWCEDKEEALKLYGHISNWDTSLITDMKNLFYEKNKFNDNINNWDVSSVTDMYIMFDEAKSFNQPLNSWNVSSVNDMNGMFYRASSFNKPLDSWNVCFVAPLSSINL